MTTFSLSYFSKSRLDDHVINPRGEIESILRAAQVRNGALGVTGSLMFNEHRFTQVLEGAEKDVKSIYASIERDLRHSDVTILAIQRVPQRRFPSWTMVFAGSSEVSKTYCKDFAAKRGDWWAMSNEQIVQLMLRMIELDGDEDRQQ